MSYYALVPVRSTDASRDFENEMNHLYMCVLYDETEFDWVANNNKNCKASVYIRIVSTLSLLWLLLLSGLHALHKYLQLQQVNSVFMLTMLVKS